MKTVVIALVWPLAFQIHAGSAEAWTTAAPREEIRPQFQHSETGGKSGRGTLFIRADEREGLHCDPFLQANLHQHSPSFSTTTSIRLHQHLSEPERRDKFGAT